MGDQFKTSDEKINDLASSVEVLKAENEKLKRRLSELEAKVESLVQDDAAENKFQCKNKKRVNVNEDDNSSTSKKSKIDSLSTLKMHETLKEAADDFVHVEDISSSMLTNQFKDFSLKEELLRGLQDFGFLIPTPIQESLMSTCIKSSVILQGQPASGKTTGSMIFLLQKIDTNIRQCQALVATSKKEIIPQIKKLISALGNFLNVSCMECTSKQDDLNFQDDLWKSLMGVHVLIGTFWQIKHLVPLLQSNDIRIIVFDDMEEILFSHQNSDFERFDQNLDCNCQRILTSTVLQTDALKNLLPFLRDPVCISGNIDLGLENVKHYYIIMKNRENEEWEIFENIYRKLKFTKAVVFGNGGDFDWFLEGGNEGNPDVCLWNETLNEADRKNLFRHSQTDEREIFVTHDVVACGIDISRISVIINFDLPSDLQGYIRRITRGLGFERKNGIVINFIDEDEKEFVRNLEILYNIKIVEAQGRTDF